MTFLQLFTLFHTTVSVVAIISGIMVVKGLIASASRQLWTFLFLCTAAATTLTGFFFPFHALTPAFILGVISIAPISLAAVARYRYRLRGVWRGPFVIASVVTLYFNCFVLIVQAFEKIPFLNALAPTQKEPPFQIAQLLLLILFIVVGVFSLKNYRPKRIEDELEPTYVSPHSEEK